MKKNGPPKQEAGGRRSDGLAKLKGHPRRNYRGRTALTTKIGILVIPATPKKESFSINSI